MSDVQSDWHVSPPEFEIVLAEQFKLYGEPIVALKDGVQVAIELLPMWESGHGRLEELSPFRSNARSHSINGSGN